MAVPDARIHLDEAMRLLTLECWRGRDLENMERVEHFTVAEELDRVDRAIGPAGRSMFAIIAEDIRAAYTEIRAARAALEPEEPNA